MTRININLGNETLALVDRYADAMGVSRSNLCAVLIAQGLMNYNPAILGGTTGLPPAPPEKEYSIDAILAGARTASEATL